MGTQPVFSLFYSWGKEFGLYATISLVLAVIHIVAIPAFFSNFSALYETQQQPEISNSVLEISTGEARYHQLSQDFVLFAAPIIMDLTLDARKLISMTKLPSTPNAIHWFMRLMVIISLSVYPGIVSSTHGVDGYVAQNAFRDIVTMAATLSFVCIVDKESFVTGWLSVAAIISQMASHYCLAISTLHNGVSVVLWGIFICFYTLSCVILLALCSRAALKYLLRKPPPQTAASGPPYGVCCAFYLIALFLRYVAVFVVYMSYNNGYLLDASLGCLTTLGYIDVLLLAVFTIVPGRIALLHSSMLADSLEAKQSFIRYVSHEMRTPLNSVLVGLTYIREEVSTVVTTALKAVNGMTPVLSISSDGGLASPMNVPTRGGGGVGVGAGFGIVEKTAVKHLVPTVDTLDIVFDSCNTALSILNELLLCDKIESGKLITEPADVPVVSFVSSSLRPFEIQCQEKRIDLQFDCTEETRVQLGDQVVKVDVHKMGQVLRNLLSNAIKFTPEEGTIVVSVQVMVGRIEDEDRAAKKKKFKGAVGQSFGGLGSVGRGGGTTTRGRGGAGGGGGGGGGSSRAASSGAGSDPNTDRQPQQQQQNFSLNRNGDEQQYQSQQQQQSARQSPGRATSATGLLVSLSNLMSIRRIMPPSASNQRIVPGGSVAGREKSVAAAPGSSGGGGGGKSSRISFISMAGSGRMSGGASLSELNMNAIVTAPPMYVRLEVRDSGAGISPENQKKLFGQYVQFDAAKLQKGGGSGLGLWISKRIVEAHGARMGATSKGEGSGTTFFLDLPLHAAPQPEGPAGAVGCVASPMLLLQATMTNNNSQFAPPLSQHHPLPPAGAAATAVDASYTIGDDVFDASCSCCCCFPSVLFFDACGLLLSPPPPHDDAAATGEKLPMRTFLATSSFRTKTSAFFGSRRRGGGDFNKVAPVGGGARTGAGPGAGPAGRVQHSSGLPAASPMAAESVHVVSVSSSTRPAAALVPSRQASIGGAAGAAAAKSGVPVTAAAGGGLFPPPSFSSSSTAGAGAGPAAGASPHVVTPQQQQLQQHMFASPVSMSPRPLIVAGGVFTPGYHLAASSAASPATWNDGRGGAAGPRLSLTPSSNQLHTASTPGKHRAPLASLGEGKGKGKEERKGLLPPAVRGIDIMATILPPSQQQGIAGIAAGGTAGGSFSSNHSPRRATVSGATIRAAPSVVGSGTMAGNKSSLHRHTSTDTVLGIGAGSAAVSTPRRASDSLRTRLAAASGTSKGRQHSIQPHPHHPHHPQQQQQQQQQQRGNGDGNGGSSGSTALQHPQQQGSSKTPEEVGGPPHPLIEQYNNNNHSSNDKLPHAAATAHSRRSSPRPSHSSSQGQGSTADPPSSSSLHPQDRRTSKDTTVVSLPTTTTTSNAKNPPNTTTTTTSKSNVQSTSTNSNNSNSSSSSTGNKLLTFLLVDDSSMNRKMLKRVLEGRGHKVIEAGDGLECLRVVRGIRDAGKVSDQHVPGGDGRIDVILMDNNMPNMGGMEATRVLRADGYTGAIFGVTGDVDDEDVAAFTACGATSVFAKPLNIGMLEAKLKTI